MQQWQHFSRKYYSVQMTDEEKQRRWSGSLPMKDFFRSPTTLDINSRTVSSEGMRL